MDDTVDGEPNILEDLLTITAHGPLVKSGLETESWNERAYVHGRLGSRRNDQRGIKVWRNKVLDSFPCTFNLLVIRLHCSIWLTCIRDRW